MISITEIVLIVAGFAAIIIGYLLPAGKEMDEEDKMLVEREIRELVRREVEDQKETIESMVDDTVDNSLDRTERAMERISNEKLSAIGEYSDTVMNDIHKNHDEVMFMYDMLNDKHKNLTSVVSEVTKKADEARQAVRDAEVTAREAQQATTNLSQQVNNSLTQQITLKPQQEIQQQNIRAILLDEESDKLHGIRIPYTENIRKDVEDDDIKPLPKKEEPVRRPSAAADESGYVNEEDLPELKEIKPEVISPQQASSLHVIGSKADHENSSGGKVVQMNQAMRAQNPDRNMQELTANDPISQNRQIIEMHKAGKSNMVIARELGLGIGEVKLVIDLSNKHRKVK